ncbi:MAG: hypothetical protein ACI9DC_003346 [Gammaproteobacteria bacterium]|jgi:hypothetical protein
MIFTFIRVIGAAAILIASALPLNASATPNILGVFTGAFSGGTEFDCRDTPSGPIVRPGPFPESPTSLTLNINDQMGNNFTGTGTSDGTAISLSGFVYDDGMVSGSFTFTDDDGLFGNGSFSGTLSGDTLSFTVNGTDAGGPGSDFCSFEDTTTTTRSSSTSNPEITAPTNISTPTELRSFTRLFTQSLTQRFNVFRGGFSGGASAVANGFMLQGNGMAAGEGMAYPVGVWGSFSRTDSKDDSAARTFKSDRNQFLGGVDISPWKDVIVGVALGYENSDVSTPVNGGNQDIEGFTAAPYVAVLLNETFSIDVSVGISKIDITQSRVLSGTTISSKVDSTRTFMAGNINASRTFGNLLLTGKLGGLYARDSQDSFIESGGALSISNAARSFRLGQVRLGAEASWLMGEFEPFASLTLEHDYSTTVAAGGSNDNNGGVAGIGVRYFGIKNNISGSLDYQTIIGRKNLDEGTFGVSLRVTF